MAKPTKTKKTSAKTFDDALETLIKEEVVKEEKLKDSHKELSDDELAQQVFGENKDRIGKYRQLRVFTVLTHDEAIAWVKRNVK